MKNENGLHGIKRRIRDLDTKKRMKNYVLGLLLLFLVLGILIIGELIIKTVFVIILGGAIIIIDQIFRDWYRKRKSGLIFERLGVLSSDLEYEIRGSGEDNGKVCHICGKDTWLLNRVKCEVCHKITCSKCSKHRICFDDYSEMSAENQQKYDAAVSAMKKKVLLMSATVLSIITAVFLGIFIFANIFTGIWQILTTILLPFVLFILSIYIFRVKLGNFDEYLAAPNEVLRNAYPDRNVQDWLGLDHDQIKNTLDAENKFVMQPDPEDQPDAINKLKMAFLILWATAVPLYALIWIVNKNLGYEDERILLVWLFFSLAWFSLTTIISISLSRIYAKWLDAANISCGFCDRPAVQNHSLIPSFSLMMNIPTCADHGFLIKSNHIFGIYRMSYHGLLMRMFKIGAVFLFAYIPAIAVLDLLVNELALPVFSVIMFIALFVFSIDTLIKLIKSLKKKY